jgi:hypothetical protein
MGRIGEMWCCNEEGLLYTWGEYTWLRVIGANVGMRCHTPYVDVFIIFVTPLYPFGWHTHIGCISVGRRDRAVFATKSGEMYRLPLVCDMDTCASRDHNHNVQLIATRYHV